MLENDLWEVEVFKFYGFSRARLSIEVNSVVKFSVTNLIKLCRE